MIRTAVSALVLALPLAGQIQTRMLDASGNSTISVLRADGHGDILIAGSAIGPGLPLVNSFQTLLASSGMEITHDGGRTWQSGQRPIIKPLQLAVDPKDANTVYALGGNGVYRSQDATRTWQQITTCGFSQFVIDPQNTSTIYAFGAQFFKSTDKGATWAQLQQAVGTFPRYNTLAVDPFHSGTVYAGTSYAGTSGALHKSTDGGDNWAPVALPVLGVSTLGAPLLLFDPNTPGLVYLSLNSGSLLTPWWRSQDNMATWVLLSGPNSAYLVLDPLHSGVLYAEDSFGNALKSEDAGTTWTQLRHDVGFIAPIKIIPGPTPTLVYTTTMSFDGGVTWTASPFPYLGSESPSLTLTYAPSSPGTAYYVTSGPSPDAFVARLDSIGQQIRFSSLLGGSGSDYAGALASDDAGNTYVAGSTDSVDFPTTPGAAQTTLNPGYPIQGFLAKFDPGGALLWSTRTPTALVSIAVDRDGSVVALASGGISRISPNGDRIDAISSSALNFTSFLIGVTLAPNGNIGVAGNTWNGLGVGTPAYLIWMDAFGNTISKTTFPGSYVSAIDLDAAGNAVIAGGTFSDIVGTPGAFQRAPLGGCPIGRSGDAAFVTRISQAGVVASSTLLGGQCSDSVNTLAIAANGDAIVTGTAGSPAFPVVNPLEAGPSLGGLKAFVARVSPDASTLSFSTFFGSTQSYWYFVAAPSSAPIVLVYANTATLTFLTPPVPAALVVNAVGNALHNNNAAVAPGEIAFVSVSGLGPGAIGTGMDFHRQPISELNGVTVYLCGEQTELMDIGPGRIYFRVPTDCPSFVTSDLRVEFNGVSSNPISVQIVPADPGLLSADGSGRGQAAALNQDGTLNTPDNPAPPGSVIRLYFTGVDPALGTAIPVNADGKPLKVVSASPAQGFFPGLSELSMHVPDKGGNSAVTLSGPTSFLIGIYDQFPVSPPLTISVRELRPHRR